MNNRSQRSRAAAPGFRGEPHESHTLRSPDSRWHEGGSPLAATTQFEYALSVVVPAYNEEHRIGDSLERIAEYLLTLPDRCELIVVDDGSAEAGKQALSEAVAALPPGIDYRLLSHEANRGKGAAVRTGCLAARGEYVAFIDADLATPPQALSAVLTALKTGVEVVVGTRRQPDGSDMRDNRPVKRRLAGRLYALAMRRVLLPDLTDSQCPLKAFRREAVQQIFPIQRVQSWSFDAELLYISQRLGMEIAEVPVSWVDVEGSHVRLSRGFAELVNLLRIRWIHRQTKRSFMSQPNRKRPVFNG